MNMIPLSPIVHALNERSDRLLSVGTVGRWARGYNFQINISYLRIKEVWYCVDGDKDDEDYAPICRILVRFGGNSYCFLAADLNPFRVFSDVLPGEFADLHELLKQMPKCDLVKAADYERDRRMAAAVRLNEELEEGAPEGCTLSFSQYIEVEVCTTFDETTDTGVDYSQLPADSDYDTKPYYEAKEE